MNFIKNVLTGALAIGVVILVCVLLGAIPEVIMAGAVTIVFVVVVIVFVLLILNSIGKSFRGGY